MTYLRHTALTLALATAVIGSWAQTDAEHKKHQETVPAAGQFSAQPSASTVTPAGAEKMAAMDSKMKAMSAMHEKMMNAKTPEEKKALMAEHMKSMQDGMAMMSTMGGAGMAGMADMKGPKPMPGNMGEHHQMMEKRMEMMTVMMQMMMDQMHMPAAR